MLFRSRLLRNLLSNKFSKTIEQICHKNISSFPTFKNCLRENKKKQGLLHWGRENNGIIKKNMLLNDQRKDSMQIAWVKEYASNSLPSNDILLISTMDSKGNVIVVGKSPNLYNDDELVIIKYNQNGNQVWKSHDVYSTVNAICTDISGNIFLTGYNFLTKWNSEGIEVWSKVFPDTSFSGGEGMSLVSDIEGNIYVAVLGIYPNTNGDFVTLKYNTDGEIIWMAHYEGTDVYDYPSFISIDNQHNVYVAGEIQQPWGYHKVVIKYDSLGEEQWISNIDSLRDDINSMTIDNFGSVYLSGTRNGKLFVSEYNTNGELQWYRELNNGYENKLFIDSRKNIYTVGTTYDSTDDYSNITTVKIDSTGNIIWSEQFDNGHDDEAIDLFVDSMENVYVCGSTVSEMNEKNWLTMKYTPEGTNEWVEFYDGTSSTDDQPINIFLINTNNLWVVGTSNNQLSGNDFTVEKYSFSGINIGEAIYDGEKRSYDIATDIATDKWGNVVVVGISADNINITEAMYDYITIKYNSNGDVLWTKTYNANGSYYNDSSPILVLDDSGNVYLTGSRGTIKYSSNGEQQWVVSGATYIALDKQGNVFTATNIWGSNGYTDILTIKYSNEGIQQWASQYNGPRDWWDGVCGITTDFKGNIYITGNTIGVSNWGDIVTIMYRTDGSQKWVRFFDLYNIDTDDLAFDIISDSKCNVFIAGGSAGFGSYDAIVVKYDSNGSQKWFSRYNNPQNKDDGYRTLSLDNEENVLAVGISDSANSPSKVFVSKINSNNGAFIWVVRNGTFFIRDGPYPYIKTDRFGNSFVGVSTTVGDYGILKISSIGIIKWRSFYDGQENSDDYINAITIDTSGGIIATGSFGIRGSVWGTIKINDINVFVREQNQNPFSFSLSQNFPNPFNPVTSIRYQLPVDTFVKLQVYNILGEEVAILVNENKQAGNYEQLWDASGFSSGIYLYRLETKSFSETKKLVLLK